MDQPLAIAPGDFVCFADPDLDCLAWGRVALAGERITVALAGDALGRAELRIARYDVVDTYASAEAARAAAETLNDQLDEDAAAGW